MDYIIYDREIILFFYSKAYSAYIQSSSIN